MKEERQFIAGATPVQSLRPFGLEFTELSREDIVRRLLSWPVPEESGSRLLITTNVDHIVRLRKDAAFRAAYRSAWMITPDGMPVYLYARLRCPHLQGRIAGSDLIGPFIDGLDGTAHRLFLVCASEELAEGVRARLVGRGVDARCLDFAAPPFGFEEDAGYSSNLARRIRTHGTTHLVIGLGAPKSEIWAHRHRRLLGGCYVLPVGAGIEFLVGTKRRAPKVLREVGLEWAWRLMLEPRRLFRRYAIESWPFLAAIWDDLRGRPLVEGEQHLLLLRDG